ncbi:hypothetical protein NDU88_003923 [Pleurodeles waltl]|uniref:Uncharacterized protein n=1 Tax=Pleurodeles waltl TaxID=8319 RepID=A0AAV7SHA5_PLEWA|nr:hypothetical protein NDU88_003923 [Pleurodeles waltl]
MFTWHDSKKPGATANSGPHLDPRFIQWVSMQAAHLGPPLPWLSRGRLCLHPCADLQGWALFLSRYPLVLSAQDVSGADKRARAAPLRVPVVAPYAILISSPKRDRFQQD